MHGEVREMERENPTELFLEKNALSKSGERRKKSVSRPVTAEYIYNPGTICVQHLKCVIMPVFLLSEWASC